MSNRGKYTGAEKRFLTIEECRAYYGVGKDNIYKMVNEAKAQMYKGGHVMIDTKILNEYIEKMYKE